MPASQAMPDPQAMRAAVDEYVAAFAAGSPDRVVALFADVGTAEDPVGSTPVSGREGLLAFYTAAMQTGARLRLDGELRICGDHVAFPFSVLLHLDGKDQRIEVIDTFRFDAANRIVEMKAYFGPANMHGFS